MLDVEHLYHSQHSEVSLVSVKLGACLNRHWALEDTMVGSGGPTQNLKLYFATNHWRGMLACTWLLHVSASFQMMRWLEPVNGNSISDLFFFSSLISDGLFNS